jgi:hypothetical protein
MKAEVSAATVKNPGRFAGRKALTRRRPVGDPYESMTVLERRFWQEFKADLPWLNSGHRALMRLACRLAEKVETDPNCGVTAMRALSSILSKMGATPVDESRVSHQEDDEDDDEFFGVRPN